MRIGKYVSGTTRIVNENCIAKVVAINEDEGKASVKILMNDDVPESVGRRYSVNILSLREEDAPTITMELEKLDELISKFYEVCGLADEMDIYEWDEGDRSLQEAKEWVNANFR